MQYVKSCINETIDFLNKFDRNTGENAAFGNLHNVDLDANIPHSLGLKQVRCFLLKYKEDIHPRFRMPFVLESIDFILTKHICLINNKHFLHRQGTAMGPVLALEWKTILNKKYHEIKWQIKSL